jgi:hypothetical protein
MNYKKQFVGCIRQFFKNLLKINKKYESKTIGKKNV